MPVGIPNFTVNLSYNNLTEISKFSLLGITADVVDLRFNQISIFKPFWFHGIPNARHIYTNGSNPSTCSREYTRSVDDYTYKESATISCHCGGGTNGTGNFCDTNRCTETLKALNKFAETSLDHGKYVPTVRTSTANDVVRFNGTARLHCPKGTHANNLSAVLAKCLGGAFPPQVNQCVANPQFTPGAIVGIVFGVLFIAAVGAYFMFLSPERRKRKRLVSELDFTNNEVELKEHLLHETNCNLDEATVRNSRMRGAWKIEEDDIHIGVEIACGSFGGVHAGMFGGLQVAVKILKLPLDEENYPDVGKDFERECETLMAIRHAHLLIFYGAGLTSDNRPFMVTEFMPRGSLRNVLADATQELPWPTRHKFALQIAKAMKYLHDLGVVHRDLKSDNCLVNDQLDVKVCDFGTSRFLTAGRSTLERSSGDVDTMSIDSGVTTATMTKGVGTILWMAPELFVGATQYKEEVDMYSYGVIMWELITREVPWNEIQEPQYMTFYTTLLAAMQTNQRPCIPPAAIESHPHFVSLMQKCWATDPASRPSFEHVIQALA
eukprot:m.47531 g.47531  ORF g.47531 m.47531 type:complete len:551 (+) comp20514_c0_seq1:52-1704(+)